ncbi:MAG: hypothetical protein KBS52_06010 [Clostridiales bacterium]|nr:hypothetical protein [Candidatus Equinaster intestinalis]
MFKQNLLKSAALALSVVCMLLLTACGGDSTNENTESTPSQDVVVSKEEPASPASSDTESKPESSATSSEAPSNEIAKISGGADEVGIYSVVVKLTKQAADKGVVEMVYHGAKGSPQENSVVNTFRIEYCKEAAGTFEIRTFFNGEVYQNQHHKDEVKVVNTFDATLRAGDVTISYTPDGGDTQEIFKADAEYFASSR